MSVTARFQMPTLIEKGLENVLKLDVYENGVRVTDVATTGTVSIYDSSASVKWGPNPISIDVDDAPVVTVLSTDFASTDFDDGFVIEWAITLGADEYIFRNEAALVRRKLYPVVTDLDLFRRASALDPNGVNPITSVNNFQGYLDEAFTTIQLRLWSTGNRPNLIMSPSALRDVHLHLTLALIFRDLATRLNEVYIEQAEHHHAQFEHAWSTLRFKYDNGPENGITEDDIRKGAVSSVWLCGRR